MVRAAVSGAFDFSRADPRDRRWWLSLAYVFDEIERRDDAEAARDELLGIVGLLARHDRTRQGEEVLHKLRMESLGRLDRLRRPWDAKAKTPTLSAEAKAGFDQWKAVWGDPKSPETAAAIDATVRHLGQIRRQNRAAAR